MRSFIVCERMFMIGGSRAIFHANDREQQAQQVAGNPRRRRFSTVNSSGERRSKFIASGEEDHDNKTYKNDIA